MDHVRYVVVVHGIGEQRAGETALAAVSRFAEVRNPDLLPKRVDVLTLGMATGQTAPEMRTSRPWLEFESIPRDPGRAGDLKPFFGRPADDGENVRFSDLLWADVMKEIIDDVGQEPEVWAAALVGRLERKNAAAGRDRRRRVPLWATEILRLLGELIALLRLYLSRRARAVDELVFKGFLGDVQLYGEYAPCRGRAVRRFHEELHLIRTAHERAEERRVEAARARGEPCEKRPARFTVIAHSLGSVLSLDALLYAHADRDLRGGTRETRVENLPFPGYLTDDEARLYRDWRQAGSERPAALPEEIAFLDTSWVDQVDALVTLGSPIDKFLVLWWFNYRYLLDPESWLDEEQRRKLSDPRQRIPHYNYCEEQDPVGHELDVAYTAPAFDRVFFRAEDRLYCRSALPGLAHLAYWKDLPLFRRILRHAVDGAARGGRDVEEVRRTLASDSSLEWFLPQVYDRILRLTYKIVPGLVIGLDFFAFTWAWFASSWHVTVLATLLLVGVAWVGRYVLDLSVWWRRVLLAKRPAGRPCSPLRRTKERRFRFALRGWKYLTLASTAALSWFYLSRASADVPWGRGAFIAALAVTAIALWSLLRPRAGRRPGNVWEVDAPTVLWVAGSVLAGLVASWFQPLESLHESLDRWLSELSSDSPLFRDLPRVFDHLVFCVASLAAVAATVFTYLNARFFTVKQLFARTETGEEIHFENYALD